MNAPTPLSPDDGLLLHRRLCDRDPLAPSELAQRCYPDLVAWLVRGNPLADPHYCQEAATTAFMDLVRDPTAFDPHCMDLPAYLRMAARADLRNVLRREARHRRGRRDLGTVELSEREGKYLWRDDDPSLPLRIAEAEEESRESVPAAVREKLTEGERRALELLRHGERSTAAFAVALGIEGLGRAEQEREVKRVKDRLKKRIERAGGGHV